VGATFDESLGDRVRVSIVASGMSPEEPKASDSPGPYRTAGRAPPPPPMPAHTDAASPDSSGESGGGPARPGFMDALTNVMREGPPSQPHAPSPREVWHGPGDVVIEEGLPHLGNGPAPPPLPQAGGA